MCFFSTSEYMFLLIGVSLGTMEEWESLPCETEADAIIRWASFQNHGVDFGRERVEKSKGRHDDGQ